MRARLTTFSLGVLALVAAACGGAEPPADPADEAFLANGKTDVLGVAEGTAEACGVLTLVNTADLATLDEAVRLDRRAAQGIIARRVGPDGAPGTADDAVFQSLAELDAVRYVGRIAFGKLLDYARQQGLTCTTSAVQLLALADFHGQLDPVAAGPAGTIGGAPVLAAWLRQERAQNPGTVTVSAGDLFGASPPLAMYFEERPVVAAWDLMRLDVEAVGNHDFDRGTAHLEALARLAKFPFVSANLANVAGAMRCPDEPGGRCVHPYALVVRSGLTIAIIGLTTTELPDVVKPGALGPVTVTDPVAAAMSARAAAAAEGAQIFVAVAHLGATPGVGGAEPTGPLIDLARALTGFDLIVGGHTHNDVSAVVNGVPVVQTKSAGQSYAKVALVYDYATRTVRDRTAALVVPAAATVTPDAAVTEMLQPFRGELAAAFDRKVAVASAVFERGNNVERLREVALGNLLADAIRTRYRVPIGLVNGGGIRAPLPSSYLPADRTLRRPDAGYAAGPPYDLVVGDAYAILPFGNAVVTRTITGRQLWAALEHSVDALPAAKGYFLQVSGLRLVFDSRLPAGSRVVSVTLEDGTPLARDEATYTVATSDFIAAGGDGYTMLAGAAVTQEPMAEVLLAHLASLGTLAPQLADRIVDQAAP